MKLPTRETLIATRETVCELMRDGRIGVTFMEELLTCCDAAATLLNILDLVPDANVERVKASLGFRGNLIGDAVHLEGQLETATARATRAEKALEALMHDPDPKMSSIIAAVEIIARDKLRRLRDKLGALSDAAYAYRSRFKTVVCLEWKALDDALRDAEQVR